MLIEQSGFLRLNKNQLLLKSTPAILASLRPVQKFCPCDLIVEAVVENLEIQRKDAQI
jgi:3-hydroxyacyl-CoA dehydrogenase